MNGNCQANMRVGVKIQGHPLKLMSHVAWANMRWEKDTRITVLNLYMSQNSHQGMISDKVRGWQWSYQIETMLLSFFLREKKKRKYIIVELMNFIRLDWAPILLYIWAKIVAKIWLSDKVEVWAIWSLERYTLSVYFQRKRKPCERS